MKKKTSSFELETKEEEQVDTIDFGSSLFHGSSGYHAGNNFGSGNISCPATATSGSGKKSSSRSTTATSTVTAASFSSETDSNLVGASSFGANRDGDDGEEEKRREKFGIEAEEETETAEDDEENDDEEEEVGGGVPSSQFRQTLSQRDLLDKRVREENGEEVDNEDDLSVVPGSVSGEDEDDGDEPAANAVQGVRAGSSTEGNFVWRSAKEVNQDTFPIKSKEVYKQAYRLFNRFLKSTGHFVDGVAPSEEDFLNYFTYLRTVLHFASTTIWCTSAKLNACLKREFGIRLQDYPNVTELLKSYDSGHVVKKARAFSPQEVCYL